MTDGVDSLVARIYPFQIRLGHGFPAHRIRELITDALVPIPTDPVPESILIQNIIITQIDATNLEITCEVLYCA